MVDEEVDAWDGVERPIMPFIRTLFSMVNGPYGSTLIEWSDDGSRVVVRDARRFAAEACPRYFSHANWSSFTRMLNMYEFKKVEKKDVERYGSIEFAHARFRRGRDDDLWRIVRKKQARHASPPTHKARAGVLGGRLFFVSFLLNNK